MNGLAGELQKYICGFREQAPDVWCTVGAGGQRARSLRRHLEVGLGVESKEEGRVVTSAGTLQLNNRRLIGCLISFTRSAGFNRSRYIRSAGKAQI